jgi:hypothetical protein
MSSKIFGTVPPMAAYLAPLCPSALKPNKPPFAPGYNWQVSLENDGVIDVT